MIKSQKDGWGKDLRKSPAVTLADVTDYLLKAHDSVTHTTSGDLEKFSKGNL